MMGCMSKDLKRAQPVRDRLESAAASLDLVWVKRNGRGWDRREGYVLATGSKWALLATPDDRVRPDGYSLLRIKDIASVTRGKGHDRLFRRAFEAHGQWPPQPPPAEVDLDSTGSLIRSLAPQFPLLCLFTEQTRPAVCFIGSVTKVTHRAVYMIDITPQAEWESSLTRRELREISRVDMGGGYETTLAEIGGPPPLM
jgi:hypothetical protein